MTDAKKPRVPCDKCGKEVLCTDYAHPDGFFCSGCYDPKPPQLKIDALMDDYRVLSDQAAKLHEERDQLKAQVGELRCHLVTIIGCFNNEKPLDIVIEEADEALDSLGEEDAGSGE